MLTKREILVDNKIRIEKINDRIQLYNGFQSAELTSEDILVILKTLIDLLEGAINRSGKE